MTSVYRPSHVGLCVSDLDRSMRFYVEGIGFEIGERFHLNRDIAEVDPPVEVTAQFIHLGGLTIELLAYASPGVIGKPSERRNQLGLTHLSFHVDDLDQRAKELEALGGTILPHTRHEGEEALMFVIDPDGTRVELMVVPPDHRYWTSRPQAQ